MDSRFDFIYFFTSLETSLETSIYMDKKTFKYHERIVNYWEHLTCEIVPKKEERSNKFIYFYKSRWKKDALVQDNSVEYICIPNLNNPRWLIRNDKNMIKNHGLIVKPTSFKAKLVWMIAKALNNVSLFTVVFPQRMLVQNISLEENMRDKKDEIASIIYTGASGQFQKFTIQFINEEYRIQSFLKLGTRKDAIERIENEEKALRYLGKQTFQTMVVPQLLETIVNEKFYGIVQSNILDKNIMDFSLNSLDIQVMNELYLLSDIVQTTVSLYCLKLFEELSQESILESFKIFLEDIKDEKINLVLSHGDYIPWNRFVDQTKIKVIDWEMYAYRPIFYDIYFYMFHKEILLDQSEIESFFTKSLNYFTQTYNVEYNERTKNIYLLVISLEVYVHYRKNNETSDEKILKLLLKNIRFLENKIKGEHT
ncbi:MAG: Unknown protein [uncultured Sulfurovum sp.]|uniref:Aminoglycoside phosphotransferase domain-containing protein n=1 Tax=uncultured Sulfurovum sp. TaxID=269237 RepID=A0A6S6TE44_9BACT|nr:MAG: Unknown protein [uncultured Sulfurovum sp.]